MLRGLWRLAWLEIKIFLREPLGAIGGIAIPVIAFLIMSRVGGPRLADTPGVPRFIAADLPIFAGLLTLASAVLTQTGASRTGPGRTPDNVIPFRPRTP